jgi:hypothetical protein
MVKTEHDLKRAVVQYAAVALAVTALLALCAVAWAKDWC